MDAAASWRGGRGHLSPQTHMHIRTKWQFDFHVYLTGHSNTSSHFGYPSPDCSTCLHMWQASQERCANMHTHVYVCTLVWSHTNLHTCTHIHTNANTPKKSKAACSHTSKELPAAEWSCRDKLHPIMINHIPAPKTNSQTFLTALRWTPLTKQATGCSQTPSLPHTLWTHSLPPGSFH